MSKYMNWELYDKPPEASPLTSILALLWPDTTFTQTGKAS